MTKQFAVFATTIMAYRHWLTHNFTALFHFNFFYNTFLHKFLLLSLRTPLCGMKQSPWSRPAGLMRSFQPTAVGFRTAKSFHDFATCIVIPLIVNLGWEIILVSGLMR